MFRLMPEVDRWFEKISGKTLKTKWDMYYLCLMAGLAANKSEQLTSDRVDMVDNFIADYKESRYLIISLFISSELKRLGIEFNDRDSAKNILNKYLTPFDSANLTNDAFQRMNEYSYGGFLFLISKISKPTDEATFLLQYQETIEQEAKRNPIWD